MSCLDYTEPSSRFLSEMTPQPQQEPTEENTSSETCETPETQEVSKSELRSGRRRGARRTPSTIKKPTLQEIPIPAFTPAIIDLKSYMPVDEYLIHKEQVTEEVIEEDKEEEKKEDGEEEEKTEEKEEEKEKTKNKKRKREEANAKKVEELTQKREHRLERTANWVKEHKQDLKRMKKDNGIDLYNISMLSDLRKEVMKDYGKDTTILTTYTLPLFDFLGTNEIKFERLGVFDGVMKGMTYAATEALKDLDTLHEDSLIATDQYNMLKGMFSKKWWKIPADGGAFGKKVIGENSPKAFLTGLPVVCKLITITINEESPEKQKMKEGRKRIIYLKPVCRWMGV